VPATRKISQTDAMGLDKRRPVIGGSYGPSLGRQITTYGIFLGVVAILVVGFILLANELDQPPDRIEPTAPWQDTQIETRPLDFPDQANPN